MSSNTCRGLSFSFIVYLLILAGLIYSFHIELFVTGVRLYISMFHDPRAERLLGDYYQNNAALSTKLANDFYVSAMKKYRATLPTAPPEEQANIKLQIGRFYLCAKGVAQNTTEAKRWFDDSLQTLNGLSKAGDPKYDRITTDIHLSMNSLTQDISVNPICQLQTEAQFIANTFHKD